MDWNNRPISHLSSDIRYECLAIHSFHKIVHCPQMFGSKSCVQKINLWFNSKYFIEKTFNIEIMTQLHSSIWFPERFFLYFLWDLLNAFSLSYWRLSNSPRIALCRYLEPGMPYSICLSIIYLAESKCSFDISSKRS